MSRFSARRPTLTLTPTPTPTPATTGSSARVPNAPVVGTLRAQASAPGDSGAATSGAAAFSADGASASAAVEGRAPRSPRVRAAEVWRSPAVRIARTVLVRFARSWWLPAEVVAAALVFAFCFRAPVSLRGFFEPATLWLTLIAAIGTAAVSTVVLPVTRVARLAPRHAYRTMAGGLILGSAVIQWCACLLLMALVLFARQLSVPDAGAFVAGAVGLLANITLVCAVTVLLLPPFATTLIRLGFLAWLALALFSYTAGAPSVFAVARLPLLPFAAAFAFGQSGVVGFGGLLALLVEAALVATLIALAGIVVPHRKRLRV
ncbi:MAG: hypothetical protein ACHQ4H_09320 [Ktedonobacterales bacterium]